MVKILSVEESAKELDLHLSFDRLHYHHATKVIGHLLTYSSLYF